MNGIEYIKRVAPTAEQKLAMLVEVYRRHQMSSDGTPDELMAILERMSRIDDAEMRLYRLPEDAR